MKKIRQMFMLQGLAVEGDMTYNELHAWVSNALGNLDVSVCYNSIYTSVADLLECQPALVRTNKDRPMKVDITPEGRDELIRRRKIIANVFHLQME